MDEDFSNEKNNKSVIIVLSVIVLAVAVFLAVFFIAGRSVKKNNKQTVTDSALMSTTASDVYAPQKISSDEKNNSEGTLPKGTKSLFIKNSVATDRWEASSIISKVTAEKVRVELDEYKNGEKTGTKKTRNMYVAVVETRPARVVLTPSGQYTQNKISDIMSVIKGYNSETGEDILFACSNESCANDASNPSRNVFLIGENKPMATVIRSSLLVQQGETSKSLVINQSGKWEYPVKVSLSSSDELIKYGTTNSISYTYPVIWNGKKYVNTDKDKEDLKITSNYTICPEGDVSEDRTLIGKINDNKYVFVISEGFSSGYLADYMLNDLGVKYAYWGAGKYATGMYINGYGVITKNNYVAHGDLFCIK